MDGSTLLANFPFDYFLLSDQLAALKEGVKKGAILSHISGSISFIASTTLVWYILRSHDGLSTTFHRLLFGLCIADIFSSFALMLASLMVPQELDYMIWNARGNTASCSAQGFLIALGSLCGLLYNCSICVYYLAIVKYQKKDDYISKKIEPWLHGVSIFFPLVACVTVLATQNYNAGVIHICYPKTYNPPHCAVPGFEQYGYPDDVTPEGYSIPCGRGDEFVKNLMMYMISMPIIFGTPIVIFVTMTLIYRTVSKIEKKMQKYGVGALRLKKNTLAVQSGEGSNGAQGINSNSGTNEEEETSKIKSLCNKFFASCKKDSQQPASRSNKAQSQSKVIFYRALAYAMAWFVAWILYVVTFAWDVWILPLYIVQSFLTPLQGLFNFCIYMYPKVMKAKRSKKDNLTWWQACIKALTSRGNKRKRGAPSSLSSEGRRKKWFSCGNKTTKTVSIPLSGGSGEKASSSRGDSQQIEERRASKNTRSTMTEEEKCEQEPGELVQQKTLNLPETVVKIEQPFNFPIKLDVEKEEEAARRRGEMSSDTTGGKRSKDNQIVEEMEDMEDGNMPTVDK